MASKTVGTAEQAFAHWQAASLPLSDPAYHAPGSDALLFALRALLHPTLRPFLLDPTLTISGQFPSLDQVASALLETPNGFAAAKRLGRDDLAALRDAGLWEPVSDVQEEPPDAADAGIGAIWGSLYLPGLQKAVPCRIVAAWGSRNQNAAYHTWPVPQTLRGASGDMEATGKIALAAALAVLRSGVGLAPDLQPGPLLWDVCVSGLPDAVFENTQGDSLQLPLALAFLSLFTKKPLSPLLAATGGLGGENTDEVLVRPVGFVAEKARSFLGETLLPGRVFLVPHGDAEEPNPALVPVRLLAEAAEKAGQPFAAAVCPASPAGEGTETIPSAATLCVWFDSENEAAPLRTARISLARQTLAAFSTALVASDATDAETLWVDFGSATTAYSAALALRHALCCHLPWPLPPSQEEPALPRMGIAVTQDTQNIGDHARERAETLARAAHRGQILVDAGHGAQSQSLVPLGRFRLLNLAPPVLLYSLRNGSFSPEAPAPETTLEVCRHNLPTETLPLVGRKNEIAQLGRLLTGAVPSRFITLVGEGGVGKTRLALEAAARAATTFAGGIWFVSCAGVQNENDLAARIADTLHISLMPARDRHADGEASFAAQIAHRLNEAAAPILLVLDNADNAPDFTGAFAARLLNGTNKSCLITSRRPLSFSGETVFRVEPLGIPPFLPPDAPVEPTKNAVLHSPAGAFFLSLPAVRFPQNTEWALVADLCRRLRGVPLALLLVAAQTPFLPYEPIARRLAEWLPAESGATATEPRILRQTLRFVMEFLTPDENALLRRIAVLAENDGGIGTANENNGDTLDTGWTRDAAIAVSGLDEENARDALDGLEARRFITGRIRQNRVYYTCLPLITEWAGELSRAQPGEEKAARHAHARYFARFAREKAELWDTPDEADAFDALYHARHQLRAVADFLQTTDPWAFVSFVADVGDFLYYRGLTEPWLRWPRRAVRIIEMEPAEPTESNALLFARLYRFCALGCLDEGDTEGASVYAESGLQIARAAHHRRDIGDLLTLRGLIYRKTGDGEKALADWHTARTWHEAVGNKRGVVSVLNNIGQFYDHQNQWDAARACHAEAAQICRRTQDLRGLCYALGQLGCNAFFRRDANAAQAYFGDQLNLARQLKDAQNIAAALINLGDVLDDLCGNPAPAVPLLVLGEQIFAKLLHPHEKEAAGYLARITPAYGQEIDFLRRDYARRSLTDLIALPLLPPRRLVLPKDDDGKTRFFLRDG